MMALTTHCTDMEAPVGDRASSPVTASGELEGTEIRAFRAGSPDSRPGRPVQSDVAKPIEHATPDGRVDRWKKLWGTPKSLDADATAAAFDEFADAFVPSHMHKKFLKTFGVPKAHFGNRFFLDDVAFKNWDTRLAALLPPDV